MTYHIRISPWSETASDGFHYKWVARLALWFAKHCLHCPEATIEAKR